MTPKPRVTGNPTWPIHRGIRTGEVGLARIHGLDLDGARVEPDERMRERFREHVSNVRRASARMVRRSS